MPEQTFYQPPKRRRDAYDAPGNEPSTPVQRDADSARRLEEADNTLKSIDDTLVDNTASQQSSPEQLRSAEEAGATNQPATGGATKEAAALSKKDPDQIGSGYKHTDDKGQKSIRARFLTRKKGIAGGIFAVVAGTGIAGILYFSPVLRLNNYLQNINQRAFAATTNAVERRLGNLMERYMVSYAINLQSCREVRSVDCRAPISGGIAGNMFQAWRDTRIEQRLMNNFGLRVESYAHPQADGGGRWRLVGNDGSPVRVVNGSLEGGPFEGGRRQFGREMNRFLRNETHWYQVLQRRSIRNYLSRKHGVTAWCFFACKGRDALDERTVSAKLRYQQKFIDRFVYPFSGKLGLYLDCITQGATSGRCSPESLRSNGIDRSRVPDEDALRIVENFRNNPNRRLSQIAIEELALKIFGRQLSSKTVAAIPVAGQIYLAVWAFDLADSIDQSLEDNTLSKFAADINSRQYVEFYQALRSDNDAMKSGALSLEEVGVLMNELEGAEDSLVWKAHNGMPVEETVQSAEEDVYLCENGDPIPDGNLVCEEKKVSRSFLIEDIRDNMFVSVGAEAIFGIYRNTPLLKRAVQGIIGTVDEISSAIVSPLLNGTLSAIRRIPGVGELISFAEQKGAELFQWVLGEIFPLPVQVDSPGREKYDALVAGADVIASEFGKGGYTDDGDAYGLGGVPLTDEEYLAIYREEQEQRHYEFGKANLFAKITSTELQDSVVNQFIHRIPSDTDKALRQLALIPLNALNGVVKTLGSVFSAPAYAQSATQQSVPNAFGVTRYGYPADSAVFTRDPDEITDEFCRAAREARLDSMTEDDLTGFDEYTVADPCLLERTVAEAGSSYFIEEEDTRIAQSPAATGNSQELAAQILANPNITYPLDAVSPNGSTREVLQALSRGEPAPVTCNNASVDTTSVDDNVLRFLVELGQQRRIGVNALTDKCHSPNSNHYRGIAVDFECNAVPFDIAIADPIAQRYGGRRNGETCAGNRHWHYDFTGN